MPYKKYTWVTDDIITADRLNNLENGVAGQYAKIVSFTDFSVVASNMLSYQGLYWVGDTIISNGPIANTRWGVIEVIRAHKEGTGTIRFSPVTSSTVYVTSVDGGKIVGWVEVSNSNNVLQLTGNQTASGNKSFSGNVSIAGAVMNYATIPSISITGYVSGSLRVSKQSGMVSINSMNLVLSKGATFTLPAGYYPRAELQAPITGQNSAGTTAGGYMTIGVDGSVTFNSMGFASGNATAYVNVHYIAQV